MSIEIRLKNLQAWLKANVQVFPEADLVTLSKFDLEKRWFGGSFDINLDGALIESKFSFSLGANGHPDLIYPMFHSPLGVPASYAAIELGPRTEAAIKNLLREALPKMKPYGYDQETNKLICAGHDDMSRVVCPDDYAYKMTKLAEPGFSVSSKVSSV